jgi:hypothetical protein
MSATKILVLFPDEEHQESYNKLKGVKAILGDTVVKTQTFDKFQEGQRFDKFDFVIGWARDSSTDDFEMQNDFWSHYSIAPVFAFISQGEAEWFQQTFGASCLFVKASEESNVDDFTKAVEECKALYQKVLNDDVVPSFNNFDKDNSGVIDKAELQQLMKELGQEIDDQQTEAALRDLDLNGDGVVDLDEFKRWYFAGMKPYNGARRSLLKYGGKAKKLLDTVKEEARNALLSEDLKTKQNKISIGFNSPENPQTTIKASFNMGGVESQKLATHLYDNLKDSVNTNKEKSRFVDGWRSEADDVMFIEMRFKCKNATAQAEKLQAHLDKMMKIIPDSEDELYFMPKVYVTNGDFLCIGQKIHWPNRAPKIDEEFHGVLNHAGQHLYFTAELGTSIEEIMSSQEPIAKSLAKGFKFTHTQCLIANMKKVFMELSKSENESHQMMIQQAMIAAPLTMLQLNANLNIQFDDFEEIENHPMAAPFLASFDQLFEGVFDQPWNEFMGLQLETEGCNAEPGTEEEFGLLGAELHSIMCQLVSDMNSQGNLQIAISIPSYLSTVELQITAPGVQQATALGLQMVIPKFQQKLDYMKE